MTLRQAMRCNVAGAKVGLQRRGCVPDEPIERLPTPMVIMQQRE